MNAIGEHGSERDDAVHAKLLGDVQTFPAVFAPPIVWFRGQHYQAMPGGGERNIVERGLRPDNARMPVDPA